MKRVLFGLAIGGALAIAAACTGSDPEPPPVVPTAPDAAVSAPDSGGTDDDDDGTTTTETPPTMVQPVADAGSWTPDRVNGLVVWLDGETNVVVTTNRVTAWGDKTNFNNSASLDALFAPGPTLVRDAANGHPVVRFAVDGTSCNALKIADNATLHFGALGFTVAVVGSFHSLPEASNFVTKADKDVPHPGFLVRGSTGSGNRTFFRGQLDLDNYLLSKQDNVGDRKLHLVVFRRLDERTLDIRVDGTAKDAKTNLDASVVYSSSLGADLQLGGRRFTDEQVYSNCLDGDIAEVLVASRSLDNTEVGFLEAYLRTKFAL